MPNTNSEGERIKRKKFPTLPRLKEMLGEFGAEFDETLLDIYLENVAEITADFFNIPEADCEGFRDYIKRCSLAGIVKRVSDITTRTTKSGLVALSFPGRSEIEPGIIDSCERAAYGKITPYEAFIYSRDGELL